jgi:hypothetical protein
MSSGRFKIVRRAADKLEVELAGDLTEPVVQACEADVRTQLGVTKAAAVKVSIDLCGVAAYTLEARTGLVALQRFLGLKASQTAFVADSAASRGLALWVMHTTEGQVIKTFAHGDDALAWLTGSFGPTTGVRPVMRADARKRRPSRGRKIAG